MTADCPGQRALETAQSLCRSRWDWQLHRDHIPPCSGPRNSPGMGPGSEGGWGDGGCRQNQAKPHGDLGQVSEALCSISAHSPRGPPARGLGRPGRWGSSVGSVGWGRQGAPGSDGVCRGQGKAGAPGSDGGCRGQGGRCAEGQAVMEENLISRVTL